MIFTAENILLLGSVLIFTSILISKTGYRFGIPTLLLFLLVGMLFGSDGLGLQFNSAEDAQFIGMMALSIILFTGGMETKFYRRGSSDDFTYRTVYLLYFGMEQYEYRTDIHGVTAFGGYNVFYRFGFCVQSSPFAENESEGKPSSYA